MNDKLIEALEECVKHIEEHNNDCDYVTPYGFVTRIRQLIEQAKQNKNSTEL